jgi:hypothetical protein
MRKIIITAIVIVVLAISYYFTFFLPAEKSAKIKQDRQTFLFNKQTECRKICEKLYQEDVASLSDNSVFNPRYAYNENKNACFYSGGSFSSQVMTKRVVNCQTNEEVLTFMTINNNVFQNSCNTCVDSAEKYQNREKEYMGTTAEIVTMEKSVQNQLFDIDVNALPYQLPPHTKICLPESRFDCSSSGCQQGKPVVFLLYDKRVNKVYRCDNKPCDGYDVSRDVSGLYTNLTPITPNGSLVKLSTDNEYVESVSLGLDFIVYRGKCSDK